MQRLLEQKSKALGTGGAAEQAEQARLGAEAAAEAKARAITEAKAAAEAKAIAPPAQSS